MLLVSTVRYWAAVLLLIPADSEGQGNPPETNGGLRFKNCNYEGGIQEKCTCDQKLDEYLRETDDLDIVCWNDGNKTSSLAETIKEINAAGKTIAKVKIIDLLVQREREFPPNYWVDLRPSPKEVKFWCFEDHLKPPNIKKVHPSSFNGMENTETLIFFNCPLDKFPVGINRLPNLKKIWFNKAFANHSIPQNAFKGMNNLKSLSFTYNAFRDWKDGLFDDLTSLKLFQLDYRSNFNKNILASLSRAAGQSLEYLSIGSTNVGDLNEGLFKHFSVLKELIIFGGEVQHIFPSVFHRLEKLEILELPGNRISKLDNVVFAPLKHLLLLNLNGNRLNSRFLTNLAPLENLEELYLRYNLFETLPTDMLQGFKNLTRLDLQNNGHLSDMDCGAFAKLSSLKILSLDNTKVAYININQLKPLENLEELSLSYTPLVYIHHEAFVGNTKLKSLLLRNTTLQRLSHKALEPLRHLQELDISGNPWLCEDSFERLEEFSGRKVLQGKGSGKPFKLKNAESTGCCKTGKDAKCRVSCGSIVG